MAAEQLSTRNSPATPADAVRGAVSSMEAPLRDAAARIELLTDALTPNNAALETAGILVVLYDALADLAIAQQAWKVAFDASRTTAGKEAAA